MNEMIIPDLPEPAKDFIKALITEFAKGIYNKVVKALKTESQKSSDNNKSPNERSIELDNSIEDKMIFLLTSIFQWSTESQFFGESLPIQIGNTIALTISFNLKEYTEQDKIERIISEQDLFNAKKHFLILGDPGSGKSTTLKRLIARNFFSKNNTKQYQYPYLIRLKNISEAHNLYTYIANDFGFKVTFTTFTVSQKKLVYKQDEYGNQVYDIHGSSIYETIIENIQKKEYRINDISIKTFIRNFLNSANLFIAIDGLDELNENISSEVQEQINELANSLTESKIVLTCRPGYLENRLESFLLTEIDELDIQQIKELCNCWINDTNTFLSLIETKSYFELANKPLFLSYLLVLYKNKGSLPEFAKDVYEEIIDFYLIAWDQFNYVKRESRYSNFKPQRKKDFLSHLAFFLTYKIKSKVFTSSDLKEAYFKIHSRFNLPAEEATKVASEIQTHTGIIIKAFFNKYEFCHLSIQEHLCATYIVKQPFTPLIFEYLVVFPSPLALVISHSTDPSSWFAHLILESLIRMKNGYGKDYITRSVIIILNRIIIESPYFEKSIDMGMAVLLISTICNSSDDILLNVYQRFIEYDNNIFESIVQALLLFKFFTYNKSTQSMLYVRKHYEIYSGQFNVTNIEKISIPLTLYNKLTNEGRLNNDQLKS